MWKITISILRGQTEADTMLGTRWRSLAGALLFAVAIAVAESPMLAAQNNSAAKQKANSVPTSGPPVESKHVHGPDGLEGWTLESPIPDHPDEQFPFTLVVARKDAIIRRISGNPFVWQWEFCPDGKEIAYETGPLHFGLQCNLEDISTGQMVWSQDCFYGLPANAPECVTDLETVH